MRFKNLRNTAAGWIADNKVIAQGEIALVVAAMPTGAVTEMRLGDGVTNFSGLAAFSVGGGISTLAGASDKASIDLPTVNAPLATALATINSTITALTSGAPGALNTFLEFANALGSDPNYATTIATALAGKVPNTRTIGGSALSADIAFKTIGGVSIIGTGDIAAGGATTVAALTDKATIDLPTVNSPLNTALGNKVDKNATIPLGTGAVTLTSATHAFHHCDSTATVDTTFPMSTTGAASGDIMEVSHAGGSGTLTFSAAAPASGYKNTIQPSETFTALFFGGAWHSTTVQPTAGSTSIGSISGTTTIGSTLTFTPATGWVGTYQWTRNGTNISGATSATYTLVTADAGTNITVKFTPTSYAPANTAVPLPAPVFTAQSAPAGTVGIAYTYTFVATYAASYAVASGSLPPGLTLNTATGVLSGTPTTNATYTFVISATDATGTTNSSSQSVVIAAGTVTYVSDDFTGTDGTPLTDGTTHLGTSTGGQTRIDPLTASASGQPQIISGNKAINGSSTGETIYDAGGAVTAGRISAFITPGEFNSTGLLIRTSNDVDKTGVRCFFNGFGTLCLQAYDAAGAISGTITTNGGYTTDSTVTYKVEVRWDASNNFQVWVDDGAGGALAHVIGMDQVRAEGASSHYFGIWSTGAGTDAHHAAFDTLRVTS